MPHGHQPTGAAGKRPEPPMTGSGVRPPPGSRVVELEAELAQLRNERDAWEIYAAELLAEITRLRTASPRYAPVLSAKPASQVNVYHMSS